MLLVWIIKVNYIFLMVVLVFLKIAISAHWNWTGTASFGCLWWLVNFWDVNYYDFQLLFMIVVEIRMKSMRISTTHDDTSLKKRRGVSVPYFFLNSYTGVSIYRDLCMDICRINFCTVLVRKCTLSKVLYGLVTWLEYKKYSQKKFPRLIAVEAVAYLN